MCAWHSQKRLLTYKKHNTRCALHCQDKSSRSCAWRSRSGPGMFWGAGWGHRVILPSRLSLPAGRFRIEPFGSLRRGSARHSGREMSYAVLHHLGSFSADGRVNILWLDWREQGDGDPVGHCEGVRPVLRESKGVCRMATEAISHM